MASTASGIRPSSARDAQTEAALVLEPWRQRSRASGICLVGNAASRGTRLSLACPYSLVEAAQPCGTQDDPVPAWAKNVSLLRWLNDGSSFALCAPRNATLRLSLSNPRRCDMPRLGRRWPFPLRSIRGHVSVTP